MKTSYALARAGSRPVVQALLERGSLRMRRLQNYVHAPGNIVGDRNEGLHSFYSADNSSLSVVAKIGSRELPLRGCSIKLNSPARAHGVYCMYGLRSAPGGNLMPSIQALVADSRMHEFGDLSPTLAVFRDSPEFCRRFEIAAAKAGYVLESGPIEYMPTAHCGPMGPFRKLDPYAYQHEIRFITTAPIDGEFIELNLGPLMDIANWFDMRKAAA
jgi:hypothetical protein